MSDTFIEFSDIEGLMLLMRKHGCARLSTTLLGGPIEIELTEEPNPQPVMTTEDLAPKKPIQREDDGLTPEEQELAYGHLAR